MTATEQRIAALMRALEHRALTPIERRKYEAALSELLTP